MAQNNKENNVVELRPPEKGLFGIDLIPGIDLQDFLPGNLGELPGKIGEAIRENVEKILDPAELSVEIGSPQPEGPRPIPTTDPKELNAAVRVIDTVVGALQLVLRLGFIIPDDIEESLRKVIGALGTIRGWLD